MFNEVDIAYHAGIDKLWKALNTEMWQRDNVAGDIASTGHDIFTLVAKRIAQLESEVDRLEEEREKMLSGINYIIEELK